MARQVQFKGEVVSRLTPIAKSGYVTYINRTPEERIAVAKKICNLYSTGKYTLTALCEHFQVKMASFNKWAAPSVNVAELLIKKEPLPQGCIPEVNQWYLDAKRRHNLAFMSILDERAKVGLMQKIEGREWEETVEEEELDPETKEMVVVKRKTKRGKDAPDTAALIFTLTNTDPERFKNTNKFQQQINNFQTNLSGLEGLSDEELASKLREKRAELLEIEATGSKTEFTDYQDISEAELDEATLGEDE